MKTTCSCRSLEGEWFKCTEKDHDHTDASVLEHLKMNDQLFQGWKMRGKRSNVRGFSSPSASPCIERHCSHFKS